MNRAIKPDTIAPPLAAYSHAIEVTAGSRTLHVSGQVGIKPDGTMADGVAAQADQAWSNITAILAAADMAPTDVVKIGAFLTSRDDLGAFRAARDRYQGDHRPAATLLVVAALARPDILIEIEVTAARS